MSNKERICDASGPFSRQPFPSCSAGSLIAAYPAGATAGRRGPLRAYLRLRCSAIRASGSRTGGRISRAGRASWERPRHSPDRRPGPRSKPRCPAATGPVTPIPAPAASFTNVAASWVQPAGHCSSGDQYAAFWVGLDGYSSRTVEQTGSEVDCVGQTAGVLRLVRDLPGPEVTFTNTVRPGDQFSASVTYGQQQVPAHDHRRTQHWKRSTTREAGRGGAILGRGHRRGALLHLPRRHLAADQLRHGQLHRPAR